MKIFAFALITCLSVLFTSCGGSGNGRPGGTSGGTSGSTTGAVAVAGQQKLFTFAETSNGGLAAASGSPLTAPGLATACASDTANAFVIVAYDNAVVTSYQVSTTASPTQISSGLISGSAPAMTEVAGKLLYVSEVNSGFTQLGAFSLSTTGVLQSLPSQLTNAPVLDVIAHPNGQMLVASLNASALQAYRVDATSGALTPLTAPLQGFGGASAHSMAFAQNGAFLLVAEDVAPNFPVDVFSVNATSGAIVRLSSVLNLTGTQFLAPHPNGRIVYAVAANSITPFTVDANGLVTVGTGTQIPAFTATAATVDRAGSDLFVTGSNAAVASFAIDATTGALTTNNAAAATVNVAPVCVVAK